MKPSKKTIFAIDDEEDILEIIKVNLTGSDYAVQTFTSAEGALDAMKKNLPDLIILDIMMSGMDGYEMCRHIRSVPEYRSLPIIFLSAKSEEFDRVLGLELGGDDYITKPFGVKELLSRVKAVLRRSAPLPSSGDTDTLKYLGIELSPEKFQLKIDGEETRVTKTEFEILHLFLKHRGKIYSRDNIINSIRGLDVYVVDRTVDVHVMNLRKKLGRYGHLIKTFSGIGYGIQE